VTVKTIRRRNNGADAAGRATPRIKDVAAAAGVSTATVSRALSKPDTVSESARQAVLEAASRTGYRINLAARNLRRQRAGAVVVLVPNLGNPFFSEILAGIQKTLALEGLNVLVVDTKQPEVSPDFVFAYFHHSRADGIISLDGSLPRRLIDPAQGPGGLPPIVFACEWEARGGFPSVRADNFDGARLAVRHLFGLGHRRIGHLEGPGDNVLTIARREGALRKMAELGLEVRESWFLAGTFSCESGARAARAWLAMNDRPTALFCSCDEIAFGFISELNASGVSVPEEVSVVGFDDIDLSRRFIPPLTTVRQPRRMLGVLAAEFMIGRMSGEASGDDAPCQVLPVELVVRASTAAPRA